MKIITRLGRFGFRVHARIAYETLSEGTSQARRCNRLPSLLPPRVSGKLRVPAGGNRQAHRSTSPGPRLDTEPAEGRDVSISPNPCGAPAAACSREASPPTAPEGGCKHGGAQHAEARKPVTRGLVIRPSQGRKQNPALRAGRGSSEHPAGKRSDRTAG